MKRHLFFTTIGLVLYNVAVLFTGFTDDWPIWLAVIFGGMVGVSISMTSAWFTNIQAREKAIQAELKKFRAELDS